MPPLLLMPLPLQALATFPEQVTDANFKAVSALAGVGKGTMNRVRRARRSAACMLPTRQTVSALDSSATLLCCVLA